MFERERERGISSRLPRKTLSPRREPFVPALLFSGRVSSIRHRLFLLLHLSRHGELPAKSAPRRFINFPFLCCRVGPRVQCASALERSLWPSICRIDFQAGGAERSVENLHFFTFTKYTTNRVVLLNPTRSFKSLSTFSFVILNRSWFKYTQTHQFSLALSRKRI